MKTNNYYPSAVRITDGYQQKKNLSSLKGKITLFQFLKIALILFAIYVIANILLAHFNMEKPRKFILEVHQKDKSFLLTVEQPSNGYFSFEYGMLCYTIPNRFFFDYKKIICRNVVDVQFIK
jgi:hypothetical protein